jgi:hypothetical protein
MANRELHNQMPKLDFPNVSFVHGLAASIYVWDVRRDSKVLRRVTRILN